MTSDSTDPGNASDPGAAPLDPRGAPSAILCLSAFGLGLSPIIPGTVASLGTVAVLWALPTGTVAYVGVALAALIFGCWATLAFGRTVIGPDAHGDPGWVVSDEVAGQALACLIAVPAFADVRLLAIAFVLFRIFDMTKIGPVGWAERRHGAMGILLDDLVAGALAGVITLAIALLDVLPI